MLSSGFISELAFLYLASGLIETSEDVEAKPQSYDEVEKRGSDYHTNKKISRRVNNLKSEIDTFITKYQSVHQRGRAKREALLRRTLAKAKTSLQLDYLACWILYLRFQPTERDKPLHDDLKWICDKEGQLMGIIDLLEQTECAAKNGEMYDLANEIVREL